MNGNESKKSAWDEVVASMVNHVGVEVKKGIHNWAISIADPDIKAGVLYASDE